MILDQIVADKRKRLEQQKKITGEETMKEMALASSRTAISFYEAIAKTGLSIIGEFKKASPSMGVLKNQIDLKERIDQYNASVDAVSCLTEEDHFHGSAEYLKEIRSISPLPVLRKDFIIDAYQIYEAKIIGADAVLLIAAILQDEDMKRFYHLAYDLGMDVLLEVHDEEELMRAVDLEAKIVGVNNRNLKDFSIHLETTRRLSGLLDTQTARRPLLVSESGVKTGEDINYLKQSRVDALLIGRAFMEAENPRELAREWKSL